MIWVRLVVVLGLACAVLLIAGFSAFIGTAGALDPRSSVPADAIVAFTGGSGQRIAAAMELLETGRGARLLVSGVNPAVSRRDVARLAGGDAAVFDCCVDLGRDAENTVGNAEETALWVERRRFDSVILVTSDFHMPRAMLMLRSALGPDVTLYPHPVDAIPANIVVVLQDGRLFRRAASEYVKYLAILLGESLRAAAPAPQTDPAA
ncbi:MAG: YdcF family protein [Maricaulaceae bacterium]